MGPGVAQDMFTLVLTFGKSSRQRLAAVGAADFSRFSHPPPLPPRQWWEQGMGVVDLAQLLLPRP